MNRQVSCCSYRGRVRGVTIEDLHWNLAAIEPHQLQRVIRDNRRRKHRNGILGQLAALNSKQESHMSYNWRGHEQMRFTQPACQSSLALCSHEVFPQVSVRLEYPTHRVQGWEESKMRRKGLGVTVAYIPGFTGNEVQRDIQSGSVRVLPE